MRDEFDNYEPSEDWEGDPDGNDHVDPPAAPESTIPPKAPPQVKVAPKPLPRVANGNGKGQAADDILRRVPPQNLEAEQSVLGAVLLDNESIHKALAILKADDFYREAHREIFRGMLTLVRDAVPVDAITLTTELRGGGVLEAIGGAAYIAELAACVPTAANIAYYASIVRAMALKRSIATQATELASLAYDGVSAEALVGEAERVLKSFADITLEPTGEGGPIVLEDKLVAIEANDDYLKRRAIVEDLLYSESISLIVGGKHHGKTTISRTAALSIAKGLPFLGRQTVQGHVLYVASDDEIMTTRMELLRMGWADSDELTLVHIRPAQVHEPQRILDAIAEAATKKKSVFIVIDMLFDFATIRDEMSYAQTREAIGRIQTLAAITGAHAMCSHHSPKYFADIGAASTAALGSQGIAARFSPIILARHWGEDLFTIESTSVRDPRGRALPQTCITVDKHGMAVTAGEFKSWMKWKLYAPRILAAMENGEPGAMYTVNGLSEDLEINRPEVQNTLLQLSKENPPKVIRERRGRSYKYWLPQGTQRGSSDEMFGGPEDGQW